MKKDYIDDATPTNLISQIYNQQNGNQNDPKGLELKPILVKNSVSTTSALRQIKNQGSLDSEQTINSSIMKTAKKNKNIKVKVTIGESSTIEAVRPVSQVEVE